VPKPWRGVTVSEQRPRFLEDFQLNYCSVSELAEGFGISRTTATLDIDSDPLVGVVSGDTVALSTASTAAKYAEITCKACLTLWKVSFTMGV
jgi:hypothetical protein